MTEHPKTLQIFSKTHKVVSNNSFYKDTKKNYSTYKNVFNEKIVKITKQAHAFKGFASTYTVEILNSFKAQL